MRRAIMAAALVFTAGLAFARSEQTMREDPTQTQPSITSPPQVAPPVGAEPSTTKSDVYTAPRVDAIAFNERAERRAKGTGVATGFIAAGVGLALLGLFARRRNHPDRRFEDRDEEDADIGPRA